MAQDGPLTDAKIPVAPAPSTVAPAPPIQVKAFTQPDPTPPASPSSPPAPFTIQAVSLVDENGRPLVPMTEGTARELVDAITKLNLAICNAFGLLPNI